MMNKINMVCVTRIAVHCTQMTAEIQRFTHVKDHKILTLVTCITPPSNLFQSFELRHVKLLNFIRNQQ